jgi:hypothetical protein
MSFQITALSPDRFEPLFAMTDEALAEHLAVRVIATSKPGFPCRVSLADAEIGDEVILVNHEHQPSASPYRATHAVYVRKGVPQARPGIGEIPEVFLARTLSLRAFDDRAMLVGVDLADGGDLGPALERLLAEPTAAYVHIHYAKAGCYAARADRV